MKRITWVLLILLPVIFTACEEDDKTWDPNNYKEVQLDYENMFYHFKEGISTRGNMPDDIDGMGIINEPWCTDLPALCGNYVVTEYSSFSDLTTPPAGEYESTCDQTPLNTVLVFKLSDGTYGLVMLTSDQYNIVENEYCEHVVTLRINYPAFTDSVSE
ncbi:hypothetical protein [Roseimarinus sediminis]|uniref:hypothetical protein n=1 Tax=Roseimarinus sediminis TaxID=1610899 RepID=UPI003D1EF51E